MVKCLACGYGNQLGHMFCIQCGAKLELKTHVDSEMFRLAEPRRFGPKHVAWLLVVLVLVSVGLLLWPVRFNRESVTSADFQRGRRKIRMLQTGVSVGPQVLTENEVNECIAAIVARTKKSMGPGKFSSRVRSVHVSFKPGMVVVAVTKMWGPVALGPLTLGPVETTYGLIGVPEVGENGFRFSVKGGKIGHFPLPGPLCGLVLSEAEVFFSRLKKERAFLDRIDNMEIGEEKVTVWMKREPKGLEGGRKG